MTDVAGQPEELRIAPVGDLDLVAGEALEDEIRQRMAATSGRVVVDLRGVGMLDSTGLRVLITLRNDARRHRRRLVLVPGPPAVQRVFALTATRGLFDWVDHPDEPDPARLGTAGSEATTSPGHSTNPQEARRLP